MNEGPGVGKYQKDQEAKHIVCMHNNKATCLSRETWRAMDSCRVGGGEGKDFL